ncbi:MAG: hypothetical protein K2Q10_03645, partial [Rhodospirillales bacterium]|nr:hypothetical protein [Rhodospirillales bacterium]
GTLRHAFDSALAALAARLDVPVVDMLRGHERPHLGHYRFYAAPDISPGLRSLRQRALSLYPLLADILPRPAVATAIDAGQSVDNALQNELGWSATALKALRGLARSGGGRLSVDNLAAALTVTPPEWFPKDPGQWAAFAWLANIPALLGHWPVERFKELGPDWRRSRERIGSHQRLKAIAPFRAGIRDHLVLMPFAMALPDWDSDLRSFEGARLVNTLMEYFLDSRALPEQVEAAQTWHARTEILRPLLRADGDLELSDPARVSAVFAQYLPCLPPSFGEPDAASFRTHPAVRKAVAAERASRRAVSA